MKTLYLVSTPIGNLGDMTFRAVEILKSVDLIAAEDTRNSGFLLKHFGVETQMTSYHDHNEQSKSEDLISMLNAGKSIAVITDAGTPGISDPAQILVEKAIENNIRVESIPGACAAISGLIVSGLPTDQFVFEGFLPHKKGRQTRLKLLTEEHRTIVFYESPYRVKKLLEEIKEFIGDRKVSASRELTKKFEETIRGTCSELIEHFTKSEPRGEFVITVEGISKKKLKRELNGYQPTEA